LVCRFPSSLLYSNILYSDSEFHFIILIMQHLFELTQCISADE